LALLASELPPLLRGREVVLRPLQLDDVERVAEIQAEPGVLRWWVAPDEADLRRKAEGRAESKAFVIESEGELVGLIQYHEENEPDFRTPESISSSPNATRDAASEPTRCVRSRAT
jgi:RimJ/RimL family protein N-acetyltransferase